MTSIQLKTNSELSYVHNPGSEPLRSLTIGKLLEESTEKYGDRVAIKSRAQNQSLTYREVLHKADKFAAGLRTVGLNIGDRVAIWAPNIIEWYITHMACARGGYILVNINPVYVATELQNCINLVEAECIICPHMFRTKNFYDVLTQIAPEISTSEPGKIKSKSLPTLKSIVITSGEALKGTFTFEEILDRCTDEELTHIRNTQDSIDPDDIAHIQFTSGTTGQPKAPLQTHFQLVNNSFYSGKLTDMNQKHHILCLQNPFFHIFGTIGGICTSLNCGCTIILPAPGYDCNKSLDAIKEEKCTMIFGTPTMYVDLIACQKSRQENINPEIAITGGASCSAHLIGEMKEILGLTKIHSVYGMTEMGVVFLPNGNNDVDSFDGNVGYVIDHTEAKVIDKQGKIVPRGTQGELCIRGYSTTAGYLKDEKKTKELMGADRWLRTGDQFIMDENGCGKVVGRSKDMIIRGGENIYPKEIEDLLNTHPNILETHVVGKPHERLGEEVCACIRCTDGANLDLAQIKDYCKGKIAHFKIPSVLHVMETFPKTLSGKVQKFKLAEIVTSINGCK